MKAGGNGRPMVLGKRSPEPTGGAPRAREALDARPNVVDDGAELEVIWYPHRDADSLLPPDTVETRHEDHTQIRGEVCIRREDANQKDRWSWLG